jgi:hypothetical protein
VVLKVDSMTAALDVRLATVIKLEEEVKAKERRILDKEEDLLRAEYQTSAKLDILLSRHESRDYERKQ